MVDNNRSQSSRDSLILAAAIFVFYFCWLGSYPFFTPDEGRYSEIAREMMASGDYITPRLNGIAFLDKPILYYWLQAMMITLFGIKEWALRLVPALLGVAGGVVTYLCGSQLYDRRTGIMAALILATSPIYFAGAHYANLDLEVAIWISCALLCFIAGVEGKTTRPSWFLFAAYTFTAFAFLTKGLIGIVFPIMIVGAWITLLNRWRLLTQIHLLKGMLLFISLTLPWYWFAEKANADFLHYFFVTQHFSRFLATQSFNNQRAWWFYLPILFAGFLPWSSFLYQAVRAALKRRQPTDLFLLLWATLIFIFFSIPHSKIITYLLPIFPALALITGRYLSQAEDKQWGHDARIFQICNLIFALILLTNVLHPWPMLPVEFNPWLYTLAGIELLGAIISLLIPQPRKYLFMIALGCNILFLLTLTAGAKYLNENTAKTLAFELKPRLQPGDEVVTYFHFFQDVPLYLERKIGIVANWDSRDIVKHDNWMRELSYDKSNAASQKYLLNERKFWKKWNSNTPVYAFFEKKYKDDFKLHAHHYYFIGSSGNIFLVSNQTR